MKVISDKRIANSLFVLMAVSLVVRCLLACFLEFGNDEVYYWSYARYPDWSHFDHPPMVGWMMQLFSLNLLFNSEFALRLSALVLMTANTFIAFLIGKQIKDERTGLVSACLFTASVYAFIITGTFILPDTPLAFFWMLALLMFVKYFMAENQPKKYLLLAGLFVGLSVLSKYTGAFLWFGVGIYIFLFKRDELRNPWLYVSALISILCFIPVIIWNINNHFVSFTFHSDRVGFDGLLNLSGFGKELLFELVYNNPIIFVLSIAAVIGVFRKKQFAVTEVQRLLLCTSLPLILLFWIFSLTRPILPHWNSPAFMTLIFLVAPMLVQQTDDKKLTKRVMAILSTMLVIVVLGFVEIETGFIPLADKENCEQQLGKGDVTMEIYGWRQVGTEFAKIRQQKIDEGLMKPTDNILCLRWFDQACIDYYVACPQGVRTYTAGELGASHKYLWINEMENGPKRWRDYWYLSESPQFCDPYYNFSWRVDSIIPVDTIRVERCGRTAKNVYVYMFRNLSVPVPKLSDYIGQ